MVSDYGNRPTILNNLCASQNKLGMLARPMYLKADVFLVRFINVFVIKNAFYDSIFINNVDFIDVINGR